MRVLPTAALILLLTVPAVAADEAAPEAAREDGPCFYEVEPGVGEPGIHPEDETFIPLLPYSVVRPIMDGVTTEATTQTVTAASLVDGLKDEWFGLYIREDPESCTGDS